MTQPDIASQQPRLCPRDGYALVLDDVIARTAIDAGWPAVALWRCRMGHSHRDWPPEQMAARRTDPSVRKPCAVCGRPLPRKPRLHGSGGRKYCPGPCTAFVKRERGLWLWHHGPPFVIEAQPWYKGPLYQAPPLPLLDPLAGRMPRDWAAGWRRVHGVEAPEIAA